MDIEKLLIPRYKVISGYPKSAYKVGDILSLPWDNSAWFGIICDEEYAKNTDQIHIKNIKPYPHLFKPLEWWEERDPAEMPEHVKWKGKGVYKVDEYAMSDVNLHAVFTHGGALRAKPVKYLLPATEAEYTAYMNR